MSDSFNVSTISDYQESRPQLGDNHSTVCNLNQVTQEIAMVVGSPMSFQSDDDDDNCQPSAGFACEEGMDFMTAAMDDKVTTQLAAAGPAGVAAAAAIVSAKKRKWRHSFETNPAIRKRQQNRLLRKLRQTMDEFATKVGQQAVVLVATPGKPNISYEVFGTKPLEDVVQNLRGKVMEELEKALAHQAPPPVQSDPLRFKLPPLMIDGIPTPVEKMPQAQLRAFIPLMLKSSTGRGKPGWGCESARPPWWPKEVPWANVRRDARSKDEKQKIPWTHALRQIVINCYKFHGREDLLPAFSEEDEKANAAATANANMATQDTPTVPHTITSPGGTISIVQVDPNNPIITLPDGATAHVQEMATIQTGQGDGSSVHTIQATSEGGTQGEEVDLNSITDVKLNSEGQIIFTEKDGRVYPISFCDFSEQGDYCPHNDFEGPTVTPSLATLDSSILC